MSKQPDRQPTFAPAAKGDFEPLLDSESSKIKSDRTAVLALPDNPQALPENKVAASKAIAGSLLLPLPSTCTAVQSGQGAEEPVKLNAVNQSPSSSPA